MPFTSDGRWVPKMSDEEKKNKKIKYAPYRAYNDDKDNRPSYEPNQSERRTRIDYGTAPRYDGDMAYQQGKTLKDVMGITRNFQEREPMKATKAYPLKTEGPSETPQKLIPRGYGPEERPQDLLYKPYQGPSEQPQELLRRSYPTPQNNSILDQFKPFGPSKEPQDLIPYKTGNKNKNQNEAFADKVREFFVPTEEQQYGPGNTSLSEILDRPLDRLSNSLTFGLTDKVNENLGLPQYSEPDNAFEEGLDNVGEGLSWVLGGGAIRNVGGRALGAAGRTVTDLGRKMFGLGQNAIPRAGANTARTLSEELAGIGSGAAVTAGAQQFVEGFGDNSGDFDEKSSLEQIGENMRKGFYEQVVGTSGSALQWAGADEAGQKLKDIGAREAKGYGKNYADYGKEFTWRSFLDPDYYKTTVAQTVPTTLALLPLSVIGYAGGSAAAGLMGLGTLGRTILGAVGGSALSAPAESALIAGQTFDEAQNRGHDEETAHSMGNEAFWKSLAVTAVLQAPQLATMFAPVRRFIPQVTSKIADLSIRSGVAALTEGTQEALQDWAQVSALGDEWNPSESKEAFALGALMGGATTLGAAALGAGRPTPEEELDISNYTDGNGRRDVTPGSGRPNISPNLPSSPGAADDYTNRPANAPNPLPGDNAIVDPENPVRKIQNRAKDLMNDQMRTEFEEEVNRNREKGLANDIAELHAWEALAMTDEGKNIITQATRQFMDERARIAETGQEVDEPINTDEGIDTTPDSGQISDDEMRASIDSNPNYDDFTKGWLNDFNEDQAGADAREFGEEIIDEPNNQIEEPAEPIDGPIEDVSVPTEAPIQMGSRVNVVENGEQFAGKVTDIDEMNGQLMGEVTFEDGDVQLYPIDQLIPEGQTEVAPTDTMPGDIPPADVSTEDKRKTLEEFFGGKPSREQMKAAWNDRLSDAGFKPQEAVDLYEEDPSSWEQSEEMIDVLYEMAGRTRPTSETPVTDTADTATTETLPETEPTRQTTDQGFEIDESELSDFRRKFRESAKKRGELFLVGDKVTVREPSENLRQGTVVGYAGFTNEHSSTFLSVEYDDTGETKSGIPVKWIVDHNGAGVTDPVRNYEEEGFTPVNEDEDTDEDEDIDEDEEEINEEQFNYEVKEMKNGSQKVVVQIPNTKRKAEFLFHGKGPDKGNISSITIKEGNSIISESANIVLDTLGLPHDLVLKLDNVVAALEGRDFKTSSSEQTDIIFLDHKRQKPFAVYKDVKEAWDDDMPFIPDYKRRGVPVQTYFFEAEDNKRYVIFREEGKSPGQPQPADVFLKSAEPIDYTDPDSNEFYDFTPPTYETTLSDLEVGDYVEFTDALEGVNKGFVAEINEDGLVILERPDGKRPWLPLEPNRLNKLAQEDAPDKVTKEKFITVDEKPLLITESIELTYTRNPSKRNRLEITFNKEIPSQVKAILNDLKIRWIKTQQVYAGTYSDEKMDKIANLKLFLARPLSKRQVEALNKMKSDYDDISNSPDMDPKYRAPMGLYFHKDTLYLEENAVEEMKFYFSVFGETGTLRKSPLMKKLKDLPDSRLFLGDVRQIGEYQEAAEPEAEETVVEPETEVTAQEEETVQPAAEEPVTEIEEPTLEERQEALEEVDDQTKLDYVFFAIQPDNTEIAAINDRKPKNVLLSYYYWKDKNIQRNLLDKLDYKPRILIDSGAYTFFNKGGSSPTGIQEMIDYYAGELTFEPEYIISMLRSDRNNPYYDEDTDEVIGVPEEIPEQSLFMEYVEWLGQNDNVIDYVIAFDEIGNQQISNFSFDMMKAHFPSIPVATYTAGNEGVYSEEAVQSMIEAVQYFVNNGADYVALGGLSTDNIKNKRNLRARVAREVTEKFPDTKFHFLGTLDNRIIKQVPGLTSADGTAWITSAISPSNRKDGQTKMDAAKDNIDRMGEMQRPEQTNEPAETQTDPDEIRARGDRTTVVTQAGTEVEVQYAFVEANSLIASNNEGGSINKNYPKELQPRERTRQASQDQINRLAGRLNPELLGANPLASDGAPIIGNDLVVESGNGRAIALKKVYGNDSYNEQRLGYMRWLIDNAAEFGLDADALELMQNPVLVRVRRTDIDRAQFAREANEASVSTMSATEQALADANRMSGGLMNLFGPTDTGELNNSTNRDFIQAFMRDVVATTDRNRLMTENGYLSQDGLNRVRNAVFAYAYGDATAISTLAESTDNNVKSILNQLLIAASRVAYAQDNINNGSFYDLGINSNIVESMNTLSDLRRNGQKVDQFLNQLTMFDEMSPISKEILRFLDDYGSGKKGKPASTISATILEYYRGLERLGDPNQESLFGEEEPPTREQLLEISLRKVTGDNDLQTSLFETEEEQDLHEDGPADDANEQGNQEGSEEAPAAETEQAEITDDDIYRTEPITVYRKGREFGNWWSESERYAREGFSGVRGFHEKSLPQGLRLLDLREDFNKLYDLATPEERESLTVNTFNSSLDNERRTARNAILQRNNLDGFIMIDEMDDTEYETYYLVKPETTFAEDTTSQEGSSTAPVEEPTEEVAPAQGSRAFRRSSEEPSGWKVGDKAEHINGYIRFDRENVTIEEVNEEGNRQILVRKEDGNVRAVFLNNLRLPGFYVEALPEEPGDVDSEHFRRYTVKMSELIDRYIHQIETDQLPRSQDGLRTEARFSWERDITDDEWRDALEAAVQIVMSRRITPEMGLAERIQIGNELEQLMKTTGRSLEQIQRQQYSTPLPLAQIAAFVLDPQVNDAVKEGSAGTGSLVITMNGQVDQVKAVELSPRRAAILQKIAAEMDTDVTIRNASTFDYKPKATAVIGNPPFKGQNVGGGTTNFSGKAPWGKWGDLGNRFLLWDLQRSLQDGGRLVYITSPGVVDNQQNSPFRQWLKENHTVRALVKFPPGVYDTRGTKFGAGLIVVDKGKIDDLEPITGKPETLEELVELLEPLRGEGTHARKEVESNVSTDDDTSPTQGSGSNAEVGGRKPGSRKPSGTSTGGNNSDGVEQPSSTGTGPSNSGGTGGKRGTKNKPNGNGTKGPSTIVDEPSNLPTELQPAVGPSKSDELSTIPKNENSVGEIIDELPSVTRYVPRRRVSGQEHPGLVIEAPGMQFVNMPEAIYTENRYLPHPKVIEGGEWKLSDIQIESVMAAKYNFLEQEKRGVLIADDTGMGKTAQILGIAADSWHSGRTPRILMITVKDQVATSSFIPENQKFGFDLPITHVDAEFAEKYERNFKDDVFKNEPDRWEPLDLGDGVVLMSQYTFRDSQQAVKKWLLDTPGDVLVLVDESHAFKNIEGKGGLALKDLTTSLNDKGQFIYASATAAEELEGLEHLYGLKVWGANNFNEFEAKLTGMDTGGISGGKQKSGLSKSMSKKSPFARDIPLTLMEQITRELKMNGQYIGRQLSMEGVTMQGMRVKLSSKDMGDWNRAVQFIQLIAEKAEEHGKKPTDRGRIMGSVVGYMRRLRGYYALKGIIDDIKLQQKSGDFTRFAISAFYVSGDEGEPAQLQNAINVINDTDKKKDGSGETIIVDIPEAIEDKADLMSILQGLDPEWGENPVPELPSPIEMLYQAFGEDTVAVVHGQVKPKDRPKFVKEFQDGKKKIIWFNEAGATGVNMHDTYGERIRFYHQDYPYAAKVAKQAEGRVNRTGQVTTPHYVYPYLDTSVDTKFVGTLMARYESMGALSRGDTAQIGGGELSNFDFTGKAAEAAAYRIIPLLEPDLRAKMFGNWTRDLFNDPNQKLDETTIRSVYGGKVEVKKFMNALMLLEFDEGNEVFSQFTSVMDMAKQEIEANGGMIDKFITYNGEQLDVQEAMGGIKLRTIETRLTPEQERSLKAKLRVAKESVEKAKDGLITATEEAERHAVSRLEEIETKQREEVAERESLNDQITDWYNLSYAERQKQDDKLNRLRTRRDKIDDTISSRSRRIKEQKDRIRGIREGVSEITDKLPDLRRAQVYLDMAELRLLGAESDIERASEVMLVDGKIATNGLLVPIRKAIRKAAEKHYKGTVPAAALQLELRGYYLENGERVVGALVPKWAEAHVAAALEASVRFRGDKTDITKLKAHIQAGNRVALENGFEIKWAPKLEQFQIWGMTPSKHRALYEQLVGDKRSPDIAYHQVSRSFVIMKDEGFHKLIERFGLAVDGSSGIRQLNTNNGRTKIEIPTPEIPELKIEETVRNTYKIESGGEEYEFKRVSPKTARTVANKLAKTMNTLFRKLKTDSRNTYAWYSPTTGGGRVRKEKSSDLRVLAHELGHAFSDNFEFLTKADAAELIHMYETYYPGVSERHSKALKLEEGLAEFFLMYVTDPSQAQMEVPKTYAAMEAFLETPELKDVAQAIQESQTLISNELAGSNLSQGMGSIFSPGFGRDRPDSNYGEEYQSSRWQRAITAVFDFTIPWRDMYRKAVENGYEGIDFTKLMAISGGASEKARRTFTSRPTDYRGRYIINYKTREEVPEFLEEKFNALYAKYGTVEKALEAINNRSFQNILEEATDHINKRMNTLTDEQLENMSVNRKELREHGSYVVFSTIAQAYRYNERSERGFKDNPMSSEVAEGIIEESQNLFPEVENLVREYTHNLSRVILTKLERAGVINEEDRNRILGGSDFYIPTFYATKGNGVGGETSGQTAGKVVKRYSGSREVVYDMLTASLMKLTETEQSVEMKRTLNAIEKALLDTPQMNAFGTFVPEDKIPVKISGATIGQQIDDFMDEPIAEDAIGDMVFQIFMPGGMDTKRGQPILMNYHGKKKVYMYVAPDLFNSFLSMRPAQIGTFTRNLAKLSRVVRYTATTLNPRYHWNAFWRDVVTAGIQAKNRNPYAVLAQTFKYLGISMGKGNEEAQRMVDQYMTAGSFMSASENVLASMARASLTDGLIPTSAHGIKRSRSGIFFKIGALPGDFLQALEQVQRYPEFEDTVRRLSAQYDIDPEIVLDGRKKIPKGKEDLVEKIIVEAGYAASEVTTNFSLHGTWEVTRTGTSAVPFLHGTLQGMYRETRQVSSKQGAAQALKRLILLAAPVSLLAWALMNSLDDDDYPSETKDRYWIFPIGPEHSRLKLTIPKPFAYAIPLNYMERFLDSHFGKDEARKIVNDWWNPIKQAGSVPLAPPFLRTILDIQANTNWAGSRIVPMGEERDLPQEQYDPLRTTTLAKWFSQFVADITGGKSISARKVDYFLNNALGPAGEWGTTGISRVIEGLSDKYERPQGQPSFLKSFTGPTEYKPIIGSFVLGPNEGGSRSVDWFYKKYGKSTSLNTTATQWAEEAERQFANGKTDWAPPTKITDEMILDLSRNAGYGKLSDIMKAVRDEEKAALKDKSLTVQDKYQTQVRSKYLQKLIANLTSDEIPKIPAQANLTEEQVIGIRAQFLQEADQAIAKEAKSKGGASEKVQYLQRFKEIQNNK